MHACDVTDIPAGIDQHVLKAGFGSKVDEALDHGIIHARRLDTRDHAPAPPVPGILAGLYPARVLDPRRRIETCHDRGADQIAGSISDHQNAPRRQQIRTGTPMNGNGWIVQSRGEPDLNARRWFTAATQVHPRIVVQIGFRDREHCGFRPAHQGNVEQVAFADRCGTHEAEFAFVAGVKSRKIESPATMVIGKVEAGQLILDQQGLTTMSSDAGGSETQPRHHRRERSVGTCAGRAPAASPPSPT